jgi:transposase
MSLLVSGKIEVEHLEDCISEWKSEYIGQKRSDRDHEKRESIQARKRVNELYFDQGYSKRSIARQEDVSTDFVIRWTQSPDQDFEEDHRGWEKGRRRKWGGMVGERIKQIRTELEEDPDQYYIGPSAIQVEYYQRFPDEELPPVRTIGQILNDLGLTHPKKTGKNQGAARYLRYPEWTIYEGLGGRVLEADLVGEKFITGRSGPIHFIGYSFKKEPRMRHYERVEGETTDVFIRETEAFFDRFETPDYVKVDNAMAMIGGRRGKRGLSRAMIFLLNRGVIPIFSVPRQPFSQASIEGNNSVFGRKFWNQWDFESVEEIDERLVGFNESTRRYCQYEPPETNEPSTEEFVPTV